MCKNSWGIIGDTNIRYFKSRLSEDKDVRLEDISTDDLTALDEVSAIYVYCSKDRGKYYVGQTNKFSRRHDEHVKRTDNRLNYHEKFGGGDIIIFYENVISANLNYIEQRLIKIFMETSVVADFELFNKTKGNRSDFDQNKREQIDKKVVVNILNFLEENGYIFFKDYVDFNSTSVLNSLLYRNTPFFDLDSEQTDVIKAIATNSGDDYKTFIIRGGAGTGKTVVMNHLIAKLIHQNHQKEKAGEKLLKVGVCIKANMREGVKKIFKDYVKSYIDEYLIIDNWKQIMENDGTFDYIIIDEAHRLMRPHDNIFPLDHRKYLKEQNKDVLELLINKADNLILFYDNGQNIRPTDIQCIDASTENKNEYQYQFKEGNRGIYDNILQTQYRIKVKSEAKTYSDTYIEVLKDLLEIAPLKKKIKVNIFGETDYFKLVDELSDLKEYMEEKLGKFPNRNSRIIAGTSRSLKEDWSEIGMVWNKSFERWAVGIDKKTNKYKGQNEIGTVHSVQGHDLDYVGVIVGKDISYQNGSIVVKREEYFDVNGKKNVSDNEELLDYIKNIYYVLLTRGIYGVRVFVEDAALRDHFKEKIARYQK